MTALHNTAGMANAPLPALVQLRLLLPGLALGLGGQPRRLPCLKRRLQDSVQRVLLPVALLLPLPLLGTWGLGVGGGDRVATHAHTPTHAPTHKHTHARAHIHTKHTHRNTQAAFNRACTHTQTHKHTHARTHIHTHKTHTNTQAAFSRACLPARTLEYHLSKPTSSCPRPSVASSSGRFSISYSMRLYESLSTSEASLMRCAHGAQGGGCGRDGTHEWVAGGHFLFAGGAQ